MMCSVYIGVRFLKVFVNFKNCLNAGFRQTKWKSLLCCIEENVLETFKVYKFVYEILSNFILSIGHQTTFWWNRTTYLELNTHHNEKINKRREVDF
jgi:hypothetical protein